MEEKTKLKDGEVLGMIMGHIVKEHLKKCKACRDIVSKSAQELSFVVTKT